ncbi:MAG: LLM class flavin-dependent oxidoreductase [Myxococcota bacterium]|nr:LLM class flavin-dependent oxidoreductase [Myxococcota bacterium]
MNNPVVHKMPGTTRAQALEHWGIDGLRLGISVGGSSNTREWEAARNWVERADRAGLHSVWMPEMHFAQGGNTSPLLALAAFATRTKRIRLATTSLLIPIHNPLRIAEEIASLDRLSRGRVIVGLGRGFRAPLFSAFGIDPATKRQRFDAALDLILSAWREEEVSLKGTLFESMREAAPARSPPPYQSPHPPLAVAAFGPKGLAQAARRGLPYLASPIETFEQIRENLYRYREAMGEAPAPGRWVTPIMRTVFVSDNPSACRRVMEALKGEGRQGGSAAKLPAAVARAVAAPASQRVIVGSSEAVKERLAEYAGTLGMNLLVVRPQVPGASESERIASLEQVVGEVLPAIH